MRAPADHTYASDYVGIHEHIPPVCIYRSMPQDAKKGLLIKIDLIGCEDIDVGAWLELWRATSCVVLF